MKNILKSSIALLCATAFLTSCNNTANSNAGALSSTAAEKVYVAPGEHDEFYAFISGGFSGQLSVYGLPSDDCSKLSLYSHRMQKKPMAITKKQNPC